MGESSLVAFLEPATDQSLQILFEIKKERKKLNLKMKQQFGILPSSQYLPHISLGYFANAQLAKLATQNIPVWDTLFQKNLKKKTITFLSAHLYCFTDMVTFIRGE